MKNPNIKTCVISPPFGNYLWHKHATRIRGSYTLNKRPGLIWQVLKTFRPHKGGWINQIGLRNKGVAKAPMDTSSIFSLAAIENDDWLPLYDGLHAANRMIEINIGCPNVSPVTPPSKHMFDLLHMVFDVVSVKFASTPQALEEVQELVEECDIKIVHACNTAPTPKGGVSGTRIAYRNQMYVAELRKQYPHLTIIGGGGIYSRVILQDYHSAGADHFSIATAFMKPWRGFDLINYAHDKYGHEHSTDTNRDGGC